MDSDRDRDSLARRVMDTFPLIVRSLNRDLRSFDQRSDLTHVQILGMLVDRAHSISELAGRQQVSLPSMSKTVQALVDRDWVERMPSPDDRRVALVKLTVSGGDALREARGAMLAGVAKALAALSSREREALAEGLVVLGRAFGSGSDLGTRVTDRDDHSGH